jgi:hypothetical protein
MYGLPDLSFLQSPEWQAYIQQIMGGGAAGGQYKQAYTPSGEVYNGPFGNDTRTPFRTVDNGFQYGNGLNASAGQLYNHFHRKAALDKQAGNPNATIADYGLTPGHQVQTLEDFANRGRLMMPEVPVPPTVPGPNPDTNTSNNAASYAGMVPDIFRNAQFRR